MGPFNFQGAQQSSLAQLRQNLINQNNPGATGNPFATQTSDLVQTAAYQQLPTLLNDFSFQTGLSKPEEEHAMKRTGIVEASDQDIALGKPQFEQADPDMVYKKYLGKIHPAGETYTVTDPITGKQEQKVAQATTTLDNDGNPILSNDAIMAIAKGEPDEILKNIDPSKPNWWESVWNSEFVGGALHTLDAATSLAGTPLSNVGLNKGFSKIIGSAGTGASIGGVLGSETGPGAAITAGIGGIIGTLAGGVTAMKPSTEPVYEYYYPKYSPEIGDYVAKKFIGTMSEIARIQLAGNSIVNEHGPKPISQNVLAAFAGLFAKGVSEMAPTIRNFNAGTNDILEAIGSTVRGKGFKADYDAINAIADVEQWQNDNMNRFAVGSLKGDAGASDNLVAFSSNLGHGLSSLVEYSVIGGGTRLAAEGTLSAISKIAANGVRIGKSLGTTIGESGIGQAVGLSRLAGAAVPESEAVTLNQSYIAAKELERKLGESVGNKGIGLVDNAKKTYNLFKERPSTIIGMITPSTMINGNMTYNEFRHAGFGITDASVAALVVGPINAAIELALTPNLKRRLIGGDMNRKIARAIVKEVGSDLDKLDNPAVFSNVVKEALISSGAQGAEIYAQVTNQQVANWLTDQITGNDEEHGPYFGTNPFSWQNAKKNLDDFMVGAAMGGLTSVTEHFQDRKANQRSLIQFIARSDDNSIRQGAKIAYESGALDDAQYSKVSKQIENLIGLRNSNPHVFAQIAQFKPEYQNKIAELALNRLDSQKTWIDNTSAWINNPNRTATRDRYSVVSNDDNTFSINDDTNGTVGDAIFNNQNEAQNFVNLLNQKNIETGDSEQYRADQEQYWNDLLALGKESLSLMDTHIDMNLHNPNLSATERIMAERSGKDTKTEADILKIRDTYPVSTLQSFITQLEAAGRDREAKLLKDAVKDTRRESSKMMPDIGRKASDVERMAYNEMYQNVSNYIAQQNITKQVNKVRGELINQRILDHTNDMMDNVTPEVSDNITKRLQDLVTERDNVVKKRLTNHRGNIIYNDDDLGTLVQMSNKNNEPVWMDTGDTEYASPLDVLDNEYNNKFNAVKNQYPEASELADDYNLQSKLNTQNHYSDNAIKALSNVSEMQRAISELEKKNKAASQVEKVSQKKVDTPVAPANTTIKTAAELQSEADAKKTNEEKQEDLKNVLAINITADEVRALINQPTRSPLVTGDNRLGIVIDKTPDNRVLITTIDIGTGKQYRKMYDNTPDGHEKAAVDIRQTIFNHIEELRKANDPNFQPKSTEGKIETTEPQSADEFDKLDRANEPLESSYHEGNVTADNFQVEKTQKLLSDPTVDTKNFKEGLLGISENYDDVHKDTADKQYKIDRKNRDDAVKLFKRYIDNDKTLNPNDKSDHINFLIKYLPIAYTFKYGNDSHSIYLFDKSSAGEGDLFAKKSNARLELITQMLNSKDGKVKIDPNALTRTNGKWNLLPKHSTEDKGGRNSYLNEESIPLKLHKDSNDGKYYHEFINSTTGDRVKEELVLGYATKPIGEAKSNVVFDRDGIRYGALQQSTNGGGGIFVLMPGSMTVNGRDGSLLKLNLPKIGMNSHNSIGLARAIANTLRNIARGQDETGKDVNEDTILRNDDNSLGVTIEGDHEMTYKNMLDLLVYWGNQTELKPNDNKYDATRDYLASKQLFIDSNAHVLRYGVDGVLDPYNATEADIDQLEAYLQRVKNMSVEANMLGKTMPYSFELHGIKAEEGQPYESFLVDNGIIQTDLTPNEPLEKDVKVVFSTVFHSNEPRTIDNNAPGDGSAKNAEVEKKPAPRSTTKPKQPTKTKVKGWYKNENGIDYYSDRTLSKDKTAFDQHLTTIPVGTPIYITEDIDMRDENGSPYNKRVDRLIITKAEQGENITYNSIIDKSGNADRVTAIGIGQPSEVVTEIPQKDILAEEREVQLKRMADLEAIAKGTKTLLSDDELRAQAQANMERAAKRVRKGVVTTPVQGKAMDIEDLGILTSLYRKGDKSKELPEYRKMLSRLTGGKYKYSDTILKVMGRSGNSRYAWSVMKSDGMTLYNGAIEGAPFHEAFHRVEMLYLTDAQRQELYKEVRKKVINPNTTDEQASEYLAELYRTHSLERLSTEVKPTDGIIKKFIKGITDFVSQFVNQYVLNRRPEFTNVDGLFKAIDNSAYRFIKPDQENVRKFKEAYGDDPNAGVGLTVNGAVLHNIHSSEHFNEIINGLTSETIMQNGIEEMSDFKGKVNFDKTYDVVTNLEAIANKTVNEIGGEAANAALVKANLFGEILDNWDNVFLPNIVNKLSGLGLKSHEMNDLLTNLEDPKSIANRNQTYGAASYEFSSKDTASNNIKLLFQTLKNSSTPNPNTHLTNYADFQTAWFNVMREVHDAKDTATMMSRLKDKADTIGKMRIIQELGAYDTTTQTMAERKLQEDGVDKVSFYSDLYGRIQNNEMLQTQLWTTFKKHRHNFINFIFRGKEGGMQYDFSQADTERRANTLAREWSTMFAMTNRYKTENGRNTIAELKNQFVELNNYVGTKDFVASKAIDSLVKMFNSIEVGVDHTTIIQAAYRFPGATFREKVYNMIREQQQGSTSKIYALREFFLDYLPKLVDNEEGIRIGKPLISPIRYLNNSEAKAIRMLAEDNVLANPNSEDDSVLGADNHRVYAYSEYNFLTQSLSEYLKDTDYLHQLDTETINHNSSFFLPKLIKEGKLRSDLNVDTILTMFQGDRYDKGREYQDISNIEDTLLKMNAITKGKLTIPTLADKKTYFLIDGLELPQFNLDFNKKDSYTLTDGYVNIFTKYLLGEHAAIQDAITRRTNFLDKVNEQRESEGDTKLTIKQFDALSGAEQRKYRDAFRENRLYKNYHYREAKEIDSEGHQYDTKMILNDGNGYRFRYFPGFDSELSKEVNLFDMSKRGDLTQRVKQILTRQVNDTLLMLDELGIISLKSRKFSDIQNSIGTFARDENGISKIENIIQSANLIDGEELNRIAINRGFVDTANGPSMKAALEMISRYALTSAMGTIEFDKLFHGDMAFAKDNADKVKRLSALNSTGLMLRLDILDKPTYRQYGLASNIVNAKTAHNTLTDKYLGSIPDKDGVQTNTGTLYQRYLKLAQDATPNRYSDIYEAMNSDKPYEELYKLAKDETSRLLKGLKNNDQTDGMTLTSPEFYRAVSRAIGEWNPKKEEAYNLLMSDKELTAKEELDAFAAVTFQPLKMMYFGKEFEGGLGVPTYDKTAYFTIFKRMVKGSDLEKLSDFMKSNDIGTMSFDSVTKLGASQYDRVYDDNQNLIFDPNKPLDNLYVRNREFKYLRRQLATDPHDKDKQMVGSQVLKQGIFGIDHNAHYDVGGKDMDGAEMQNTWLQAMNDLTRRGVADFENKTGITEDANGDYHVEPKTLYAFLQKDAWRGTMPQNMINALKTDNEGNYIIQPSVIPSMAWIQSRLLSQVKKSIIDTNLPGNAFIQMSNFGFKNSNANVVKLEDGSREYSYAKNKELRFKDPKNRAEAMISVNMLKQLVPAYKDMTYDQLRKLITDQDFALYTYRIPTQGQSSIVPVTIVDILPESSGDTIVLPSEITTFTGSDFDIDKMFVASHNYDFIYDKFSEPNQSQDEINYFYEQWKNNPNWSPKFGRDIVRTNIEDFNDIRGRKEYGAFNNLYYNEKEDKWYSTIGSEPKLEKVQYDHDISMADNSQAAVENLLLDMYLANITSDSRYVDATIPLDAVTGPVQDVVKDLAPALLRDSKNSLDLAFPRHQLNTKNQNIGAGEGIGPFALHTSHHVLTSMVKMALDTSIQTQEGTPNLMSELNLDNLYEEYDKDGVPIMNWLSAMISAHVDAAKDPYILQLNFNPYTYDVAGLLFRTGFGKNTLYYLPQPILRDVAKTWENQFAGKIGVDDQLKWKEVWKTPIIKQYEAERSRLAQIAGKSDLVDNTMKAKTSDNDIQTVYSLTDDGTNNNYAKVINSEARLKKFILTEPKDRTWEWYDAQLGMLKYYEQFQTYGKALTNLMRVSQIDTAGYGSNATRLNMFRNALESVIGNEASLFTNVEPMFKQTHLWEKYQNSVERVLNGLGNSILEFSPAFDSAVQQVLAGSKNSQTMSERTVNNIINEVKSVVTMPFFDQMLKDQGKTQKDLFIGENSVVSQFERLIKRINADPRLTDYRDNKLLKLLQSGPTNIEDSIKHNLPRLFTTSIGKERDAISMNDYTDAWRGLLQSIYTETKDGKIVTPVSDFAKDLIAYAYYISGGNPSGMNNFFNMVPYEVLANLDNGTTTYNNYIKDMLTSYGNKDMNMSSVIDQAYKSLWYNSDVIKQIGTYTVDKGIKELSDKIKGIQYKQPIEYIKDPETGKANRRSNANPFIKMTSDWGERNALNKDKTNFRTYVQFRDNVDKGKDQSDAIIYKYVGYTQDTNGRINPIYQLVNKLGYAKEGYYMKESTSDTSMINSNKELGQSMAEVNIANYIGKDKDMVNYSAGERFNYATGDIVDKLGNSEDPYDQFIVPIEIGQQTPKITTKFTGEFPGTITTSNIVHTTDIITRNHIKANPNTFYLFGDNDIRKGLGGQAKEMRGESNTFGISTKKLPSNELNAFKTDTELLENKRIITQDINNAIDKFFSGNYDKVKIPKIGIGLAKLPEKAPQTYAWLQKELQRFIDTVTGQIPRELQETEPQQPKEQIVEQPTQFRGQMKYDYGENKRSDITSNSTFDAIMNGERTATTRYASDGNLDYWKKAKVGDIITFDNGKGQTIDVRVTKPLYKLEDSGMTATEWSKLEGWSTEYFNNNVKPRLSEAWQMQYELVDKSQQAINRLQQESSTYIAPIVMNTKSDPISQIMSKSDHIITELPLGEKLDRTSPFYSMIMDLAEKNRKPGDPPIDEETIAEDIQMVQEEENGVYNSMDVYGKTDKSYALIRNNMSEDLKPSTKGYIKRVHDNSGKFVYLGQDEKIAEYLKDLGATREAISSNEQDAITEWESKNLDSNQLATKYGNKVTSDLRIKWNGMNNDQRALILNQIKFC